MKIYKNIKPKDYPSVLRRPAMDTRMLFDSVRKILEDVRTQGDKAVRAYSLAFDKIELADFRVPKQAFIQAENRLPLPLKQSILTAKANIEKFHKAQRAKTKMIETMPGIQCWRQSVGIESVGLYIPGGTAPLFSTVLMLGIPAKIAACKEVVLCTPPNTEGDIHPAILYAAQVCGISKVYKIGGVQAIGAMAYGTKTVPKVYKIFGPGNQYVMAAKQLINTEGGAIDMPAGPSEVLVIADDTANPCFVAADLLSQAEHGTDSQVVLLAYSENFVQRVVQEIERQLVILPRRDLASTALGNSIAIVVENSQEAMRISNHYAPEHLILQTADADKLAAQVLNAGSVFIGHLSPESVGDYASGTNHTLPTNGFAHAYSGVSVDSFVKKITFQRLDAQGLKNIGQTVVDMAEMESLKAHAEAIRVRLTALENLE
jgi:histidinol dehydrogenase